ncbi:hypothetical protein EDD16DRAFT_89269 [Pisolithus croceorrhizus]|nr:hypothetical protein EDD16DRAFT_89269 [Pisolithus croceorrhizus]
MPSTRLAHCPLSSSCVCAGSHTLKLTLYLRSQALERWISLSHPAWPMRLYNIVILHRFLYGKHVPCSIQLRYGPPEPCCIAVPGQPNTVGDVAVCYTDSPPGFLMSLKSLTAHTRSLFVSISKCYLHSYAFRDIPALNGPHLPVLLLSSPR